MVSEMACYGTHTESCFHHWNEDKHLFENCMDHTASTLHFFHSRYPHAISKNKF